VKILIVKLVRQPGLGVALDIIATLWVSKVCNALSSNF